MSPRFKPQRCRNASSRPRIVTTSPESSGNSLPAVPPLRKLPPARVEARTSSPDRIGYRACDGIVAHFRPRCRTRTAIGGGVMSTLGRGTSDPKRVSTKSPREVDRGQRPPIHSCRRSRSLRECSKPVSGFEKSSDERGGGERAVMPEDHEGIFFATGRVPALGAGCREVITPGTDVWRRVLAGRVRKRIERASGKGRVIRGGSRSSNASVEFSAWGGK